MRMRRPPLPFAALLVVAACNQQATPPQRKKPTPSADRASASYAGHFQLPATCVANCCNEIDYNRGRITCGGQTVTYGSGFAHMVGHHLTEDSAGVEGHQPVAEGGQLYWGQAATSEGPRFCAVVEFAHQEPKEGVYRLYHEFCGSPSGQARDIVLSIARSYHPTRTGEQIVCPYCG